MHGIALWAISLAALAAGGAPPPLRTVAHVDLNRYLGKWYEIARYPNRFERSCDRDVTAEYSQLPGGRIRVVNSCLTAAGQPKRAQGRAVVVDRASNARLKVTFFWPFYGQYWILELGPEYDYAVVGEPSRHYLWILSRTPQLPEALYQAILARLPEQGYDPARFQLTRQTAAR